MPEETKPKSKAARDDHDELPELPAIDDDGSAFEGSDDFGVGVDGGAERDSLDDATAEREPIDAWLLGALVATPDERITDDDDEAAPVASDAYDAREELLGGGESGLTDESDEPDGRAIDAEEAGIFADSETAGDDGGAEGTNEDPALAIDRAAALAAIDGSKGTSTPGARAIGDDDGLEDDSSFEDVGAAGRRATLERQPWPRRADAAWSCEQVDDDGRATMPPTRASDPRLVRAVEAVMRVGGQTLIVAHGDVIAAASFGAPLAISSDGGARFTRLPSCSSVSALAAVPGAPGGRALVVALYDAAHDVSGLVLVRVVLGEVTAELVAEGIGARAQRDDDAEEWARIEALGVEVRGDGGIEVMARGMFGGVRARG